MHAPVLHKTIVVVCFAALVFTGACAHQPPPVTGTLQSFHEFTLHNGIKVVVRQNPMSRIHSIVLYIQGGTGAVPADKAGLDTVALQLQGMASERYPDPVRRDILKRTSSSIQAATNLDFSTFQLKTIDTYFAETFDLYLDLIMRPAFPPDLFREVITNEINAYRSELTDGYARASRVANRSFFAGHPYESHITTPATLNGLDLQDVRDFYRHTMVASRMRIFASGNFKLAALEKRLNASIGSLPAGDPAPAIPRRFPHGRRARLLLDSSAQLSPDASYLRGNVAIVQPNHRDYYPLELAGKMLTDIMNDLLRTRNALVYSSWAAIFEKKANYANMSAYRTCDPVRTIELIMTAIDILSDGKCVSPYSQKEIPGTYIHIDKALAFYKTAFSTEYFSRIQDNAAVALSMAAAYHSHGDCRQFLASTENVDRVSAGDVVRAVKRHLRKEPITWALSAHPDTIAAVEKKCGTVLPACEPVTLE